jgi:hypothetical protein
MFRLWLITALSITIILLFNINAATAFKGTFKVPCMISYNGRPPITMLCISSISVSQGTVTKKSRLRMIERS